MQHNYNWVTGEPATSANANSYTDRRYFSTRWRSTAVVHTARRRGGVTAPVKENSSRVKKSSMGASISQIGPGVSVTASVAGTLLHAYAHMHS